MQLGWAGRPRLSFWLKLVAGAGLVALADQLFLGDGFGATLGGFALIWTATLVALRPATRRRAPSVIAIGMAAVMAIIQIDHPSLIGWMLFWLAMTVAALSPRCAWIGDSGSWAWRIVIHAWLSFAAPFQDGRRLRRLAPPTQMSLQAVLATAALPFGGGVVFLALFASANPIIAQAVSAIRLPTIDLLAILRAIFWVVIFIGVWATLRPARRAVRPRPPRPKTSISKGAYAPAAGSANSVALALIIFNGLFAIENALDLTFLWSGAGLPRGMTLAQYAHRGAYPLIATALLAGGFSLFFLREGSDSAARPLIRRLVGLWVAQNVLLCASSILRTLDYIQAYSLTSFRIAALLWMGLVTIGLALIGWRIVRNKSRAWLINANMLALGVVLFGVSLCDLGAAAAAWNVRHARDVGGPGAELDVCYLERLGPSALLPVLDLEQRRVEPGLRVRLEDVRRNALITLETNQRNWRTWTWRGQRRLDAAQALGHAPASNSAPIVDCNGTPLVSPPLDLTRQAKP